MILDFIRDNLDGESWEKWCDNCYRERYQSDNFTKIPATHSGDDGIEGFTHSGVVYQCYCPEKNYSDDDLYTHLRDKATRDVNKFTNKQYAVRLKALGLRHVIEWHFVIPEYKDKRIIEHLEKLRKKVIGTQKDDPDVFSYIDPKIQLVIKTAEDFKWELVRLIRNPLVDLKLNVAIKEIKDVDWTTCKTEKINNIKRKIKAIMHTEDEDKLYKDMVKYWAESYLKGIEIMSKLQLLSGSIYEDLFELEQQYKKDVSVKSKMNNDRSINYKLFMEILDDFEKTIGKQFECFSEPSIKELKSDLVSGWLADCSLEFKDVENHE
jgi:Predicted Co/Zn/Cd cation transporters